LESDFGVTEATIGIFFVYVGALSVVMRAVILGKLVDWLGEARVMQIGAVLLTIGLFAIPFPRSVVSLGLIIALVPIGTACLFPSVTALVTRRAAEHERGQTLGVQQAFGGVSRVIAPLWATAAFQGLGRGVPFFIAAGVVGIVTVLSFRVPPRGKIPEAAV
jgi:MFS family permease